MQAPLFASSNINIGNSTKSIKSSTKHCNSEKIRLLRDVFRNVFFFRNLTQGLYYSEIYITQGFFC